MRSRPPLVATIPGANLLATTAIAVVFLGTLAVPAAAAGWHQYEHDAARTNASPSETSIGVGTVGDLHRLWTYVAPARSSAVRLLVSPYPVVARGTIVFQSTRCADAACTMFRQTPILGLDARTGRKQWAIGGPVVVEKGTAKWFFAVSHGNLLTSATSRFSFDVVDYAMQSQRLRWFFSDDRCGAYPTVARGSVFIESGGITCVTSVGDGNLQRIYGSPLKESGLPAIGRGRLFVAGVQGIGDAYDTATGGLAWHSTSLPNWDPMVAGRTVVYRDESSIDARRVSDGSHRWTRSYPSDPADAEVRPSLPAYLDGTLFEAWSNGAVQAFDPVTGDVRWTTQLGGPTGTGFRAPAQPAVANGVVYGSVDAPTPAVVAMDASTGHILRVLETPGGITIRSIMVGDGVLFAVMTDRIVAWGLPQQGSA
jgi:PQQ-like domain